MRKTILSLFLAASALHAQVNLGGHVQVPSPSDSTLGQSTVTMTSNTCTLTTASGCTVTGGAYTGTLVVTGTLTATGTLILPLSPGRTYNIENNTSGGFVLNVGGATGGTVTINNCGGDAPTAACSSSVFSDGSGYTGTPLTGLGLVNSANVLSVAGAAPPYNQPSYGSVFTPKMFRGVYDVSTFSGSDLAAQLNACNAQVIADGAGACDASMFNNSSALSNPVVLGNRSTNVELILPSSGLWSCTNTGYTVTSYTIAGNVITVNVNNNLPTTGTLIPFSFLGFGTSTFLNQATLYPTSVTATQIVAPFTHANASATESGKLVVSCINALGSVEVHPKSGSSSSSANVLEIRAADGSFLHHVYSTYGYGSYTHLSGVNVSSFSGATLAGVPTSIQGQYDQSSLRAVNSNPPGSNGNAISYTGSGGSCTSNPVIYFRAFQGSIVAGVPGLGQAGAGCGTGSGVTWSKTASDGLGSGVAFTTTWSSGSLATVTVTSGGSGYGAVMPFGMEYNGCCGGSIDLWQGGVHTGGDNFATGITTTAGSLTIGYQNISTDNLSLLIGANVETFDNLNANNAQETVGYGTIASITGTTITLTSGSSAVNKTTSGGILLITPQGVGRGTNSLTFSNFTANQFQSYPGLPTVAITQSGNITVQNGYAEQDNTQSSNVPFLFISPTSVATDVLSFGCGFSSGTFTATQECIQSGDPALEVHGSSAQGGSTPNFLVDKYWNTVVGYQPGLPSGLVNYSHASIPHTVASFVPNTVGWYRVIDTSLANAQGSNIAATMEVSQAQAADSLWEIAAGSYGPASVEEHRATYNGGGSGWGSVTKVEVSANNYAYYVDLYVSNTSNTPVIVKFSNMEGVQQNVVIQTPVVNASPSFGPWYQVVDLTALSTFSSSTAESGSHYAAHYNAIAYCTSSGSPAYCNNQATGRVTVAAGQTSYTIYDNYADANTICSFTWDTTLGTAPTNLSSLLVPTTNTSTAGTIAVTIPVAPVANPIYLKFSCHD